MTDRDDATLSFLSRRRSWPPRMLAEPAPDDAALNELLTIALRVPDHAKLEPWRLIVMRREALDRLRPALTAAAEAQGMDEAGVKKTVSALDSPLIVAVISAPREHAKVPEWEQLLSAGNVCLSLLNAANAGGWAAAWLSGPMATDAAFGRAHLGLSDDERIVGLIHIGSRGANPPPERPRPDIEAKITRL